MTTIDPVDTLVRGFARLLAAVWAEVLAGSQFSGTGSFLEDWLQANWEMFVEAGLQPGVVLEVYGEGADCNDRSSRVYRPEVVATHAVVCLPKAGTEEIVDILSGSAISVGADGLPMEEVVSVEGSWYARKPPFDCVLVKIEGRPCVFRIEDVIFGLGPASRR